MSAWRPAPTKPAPVLAHDRADPRRALEARDAAELPGRHEEARRRSPACPAHELLGQADPQQDLADDQDAELDAAVDGLDEVAHTSASTELPRLALDALPVSRRCYNDFAYIAGYTSGGAPYGVTWEEMGETPPWSEKDEDEIPF